MTLLTNTITYYRSTNFSFDVTITPPTGKTVTSGLFTVKSEPFDSSATDSTALVQKTVAGASNVCTFNMVPGDVSDATEPGTYYYSIHIKLSDGMIYPFASGKFMLKATSTNRES